MTTKHLDLSVLEDLPLEQLQAAQEKLAALLQRQQDGKKREALKEIRELTIRHELTFEEVVAAVRTTTKRAKAPALFRNPDNPRQTWSGKGEAPSCSSCTRTRRSSAFQAPSLERSDRVPSRGVRFADFAVV